MDRIIPFSELRKVINEAYEEYKDLNEGKPDKIIPAPDRKAFGISVCLADGTIINKGDADKPSAIGSIVKIPVATMLLTQNSPEELVKKDGVGKKDRGHKPHLPFSTRGLRAVSALEPHGDSESKWNFIANRLTAMMGSAPDLDIELYKSLTEIAAKNDVENMLARDGFYLYDDAKASIDIYMKALSMKATAEQLAVMGATIAADGINPVTRQVVFDGELSQKVVAMMAAKGPHKMRHGWLVTTGLPAKSGFGGAIVGVMPGVMSLAAYSPLLDEHGVSVKAAKALCYIMNKLDMSVFASARVRIDNER